jgi:glycogen debranching enzyme
MPPDPSRSSELALSSARDSEQLVCARGSLFLVTERHGDVAPSGARELGLFYNDTRYLSHLELRIADVQLVHLSAQTSHDAFNQIDLMVSGLDHAEFLDDAENYLHVRRRQLLEGGLVEEVTLTNFLNYPVSLTLAIGFDADFADIFEVRGALRQKRGQYREPRVTPNEVIHAYDGVDGVRYATELAFSPTPAEISARHAVFRFEIHAGGSQKLEYTVTPGHAVRHRNRARIPFAQRAERQLEETRQFREASTRVRCDNALLQDFFERSVADLFALRVQVGDLNIVAAGIPWFCCPFGRDSLLTSYEALTLNPDLATESLCVLADFQGKRDFEPTEEEPGKIFHELRFGEMANAGETPHSPYYGTIDATPLFVIVADAARRVTGDLEFVQRMREPVLAALGWIDRKSEKGTQLVSYRRVAERGLDNQGWKDSRAAVSFPDGRRGEPPIALCEVQGYCIDAYTRGARLLAALGETQLSETYASRAATMREVVNERMWLPSQNRYAYAIDGQGRVLPTVVSNLGHLLWSRIAPAERATATADLLLEPNSFSGFGIRTLAAGPAVYNPLAYHNGTVWPHDNALIAKGFANYGMTRRAAQVFDGLIRAMGYFPDKRLPELFCGLPSSEGNLVRYPVACSPQAWAAAAPYLLLQASLGLHLDAPRRRLLIRNAHLPESLEWVELEGLRIGSTRVTLRLRRAGERVHVERLDVTGPSIRTDVEID